MSSGTPAALILGLDENGYGLVRSLARMGIPLAAAYGNPREFGRWSRYCSSHFIDFAASDEGRVCDALIGLAQKLDQRLVVFASSDYQAMLLCRHQERLASAFAFHWIDHQLLSRIIDKSRIAEVCQELGVTIPRTHIPDADEDLYRTASEFPLPCLVKAARSFASTFPAHLRAFVANRREELLGFYKLYPGLEGKVVWQQIVEGGDENVFQCNALIRQDGEIGGLLGVRKLHQYPPGFGSMAFGRSEENEFVTRESLKILRRLDYRGLASLEFKFQPKDGTYYFIEMNPRMPWYNSLIADAGVNLPYLAYLDLIGNTAAMGRLSMRAKTIHWVSFEMDLRWFAETRRNRSVGLFGWLQGLLRARSFAWWDWHDPLPFSRSLLSLLSMAAKKIARVVLGTLSTATK